MSRARRGILGRVFDWLSWPVAACLCAGCLSWVVSGQAWILDISANLTAQWLLLTAAALLVWVVARRRALAAVAAVGCISCLIALGIGRAAYWPREVGSSPRDTPNLVRFLHYNASALGDGAEVEGFMRQSEADVISIVCPPVGQQTQVIYGRRLEDEYGGKLVRGWRPGPIIDYTDITAGFVVSHWPLEAVDTSWLGDAGNYLIAGVVHRPIERGGDFAVIAVHPRSPRNQERWRYGNTIVEAVGTLAGNLRERGLAVVVLTDLNSTPTGYRSHRLYWQAGLRRCKPLLLATGTYPKRVPIGTNAKTAPSIAGSWPASVAIDDCLVSRGVKVLGWMAGPRMPSGHLPTTVELSVPGPGRTNK